MADDEPVNPRENHSCDTQYVGMANLTNLFEAFDDFKTSFANEVRSLLHDQQLSIRDQQASINDLAKKIDEIESKSQPQNIERAHGEPQSPYDTPHLALRDRQNHIHSMSDAHNTMHQPRSSAFTSHSDNMGPTYYNQGRESFRNTPQFSRSEPLYRPDSVRYDFRPNSAPIPMGNNGFPQYSGAMNGRPINEETHVRIKPFNAKDTDWLDYREHFIQIATKANWSDNTCSMKLLAAMDNSLLGVTNGLGPHYSFEELLAKLDSVNGADFARREACGKLESVQKLENESIALYAERVRRLVNRAYTNYSQQAKDEQTLKYFIDGLPTKRSFRMNMKLKGFTNLQDAISHASLLDHVLHEEVDTKQSTNHRAVNVPHDVNASNKTNATTTLKNRNFQVGAFHGPRENGHQVDFNLNPKLQTEVSPQHEVSKTPIVRRNFTIEQWHMPQIDGGPDTQTKAQMIQPESPVAANCQSVKADIDDPPVKVEYHM